MNGTPVGALADDDEIVLVLGIAVPVAKVVPEDGADETCVDAVTVTVLVKVPAVRVVKTVVVDLTKPSIVVATCSVDGQHSSLL